MTTGPEEFEVMQLLAPIPLDVAATVMCAVGAALEAEGWDVYVKERTGVGRVWIRRASGAHLPTETHP